MNLLENLPFDPSWWYPEESAMEASGASEDGVDVKQYKIDTVDKKFTILNYAWEKMEKSLPRNQTKLFRHIAEYHNANIDRLETLYMTDYPVWVPGKDSKILYDVCGLDEDEMEQVVKDIELPDFYKIHKYYITAAPVTILLLIRYYLLKGDKKAADLMYYYMAYCFYWMAFTRQFKRFKPDLQVVMYTMNHLSNKFYLKQYGSINKWLYWMVADLVESFKDRILSASDYEIYITIDAIRTKIGNRVNTLGKEIHNNAKNKDAILKGNTVTEEGDIRDSNAITESVIRLSNEYTSKFFSNAPSEVVLDRISRMRNMIGKNELRNAVTYIMDDPKNYDDVNSFFQSIFYLFLQDEKYTTRDIHSMTFLNEMDAIYRKGNSNDKNIRIVKDLLDKWLKNGSALYRETNRQNTIQGFRRAIFFYFVYIVATDQ